jgi:hypothetical protein
MKKIMLWGWDEQDQKSAVKEFAELDDIEVVEWVGDSNQDKSFVKFLYNQPEWGAFSDFGYSISGDDLHVFLRMFSREKRSSGIDYHEQVNIGKSYFRYFINLLKKKDIDIVYFSLMPVTGFDYLLYIACKKIDVYTAISYQCNFFKNRFYFCDDIDDFGIFNNVKEHPFLGEINIKWGFEKDIFYMRNDVVPDQQINPYVRFIRQTLRFGLRKSSKPMRYSGVIQHLLRGLDFRRLYKKSAKYLTDAELASDFIYFPLHLQPELTTSCLGGDFSDQLDAIERLANLLPPGWKIYAKENPKQGDEQRGVEFFNRLKIIPNVVYVSKDFDTYKLMANCKLVATITGTAGFEAITGGKNCIYFGRAWYKSIPGATPFSDDLDLLSISRNVYSREDQEAAIRNIYSKTREGILDKLFLAIYPEYDSRKNVNSLLNYLIEVKNSLNFMNPN